MEKKNKKIKNNFNGQELIMDLYDCDPKIITSKKKIIEYINKICVAIKVKKFGPSRVERFGAESHWGTGYSFFQFIEESSICGHFLENKNIAFINIFSCKPFSNQNAINFTNKFFKSKKVKKIVLLR